MKKTLLFVAAAMTVGSSFAQQAITSRTAHPILARKIPQLHAANKTTGIGDTMSLSNISSTDTLALYLAGASDSGYVAGMNLYGAQAFAERYDINGADSSVNVLGVITQFTGSYSPTTTRTVSLNAWAQGPQTAISGTPYFYSGLPTTSLANVSVPLQNLGIGVNGQSDSLALFYFTAPTGNLSKSFFVGYSVTYTPTTLNGDTISLLTNLDGERTSPIYNVVGGDTVINDQNAFQQSGSTTWQDFYLEYFNLYANLAIYPLVAINDPIPAAIPSVQNKGLSFSGLYPNPATTTANVNVSLTNASDITINVMDAAGRTVQTTTEHALAAGAHTIQLNTAALAAGQYICVIKASIGGGIATKLNVVR